MTKIFLGLKIKGCSPPWAEPVEACPAAWKNFIRSIVRDYDFFKEYYSNPESTIRKELKKFNALMISIAKRNKRYGSHHSYVVEFESEHDYLIFLLTYNERQETWYEQICSRH